MVEQRAFNTQVGKSVFPSPTKTLHGCSSMVEQETPNLLTRVRFFPPMRIVSIAQRIVPFASNELMGVGFPLETQNW